MTDNERDDERTKLNYLRRRAHLLGSCGLGILIILAILIGILVGLLAGEGSSVEASSMTISASYYNLTRVNLTGLCGRTVLISDCNTTVDVSEIEQQVKIIK